MFGLEERNKRVGDEYDLYRCNRCLRLITLVEERRRVKKETVCPCGGTRYSPTNLRWYEWLLPRVWHFSALRLLGRI